MVRKKPGMDAVGEEKSDMNVVREEKSDMVYTDMRAVK